MARIDLSDAPSDSTAARDERVIQRLGRSAPPALREFARAVLRRAAPAQVAAADPGLTAAAIAEAFAFGVQRGPDDVRIRVTGAVVAVDGWRLGGPVVEIACADRPLLVTSVVEELHHRGVRPVRSVYTPFGVERDADGMVTAIGPARGARQWDCFLQLELGRAVPDPERRRIVAGLRSVVADVVAVTDAFPAMHAQVEKVAASIAGSLPEEANLLRWLLDDTLVLVACREVDDRGAVVPRTALGLSVDVQPRPPTGAVDVRLTRRISTVHRREPIYRFSVPTGPSSFELFGIFTRKGRTTSSAAIPLLRAKLNRVLELQDAVEGSEEEVALTALFEMLPKDELFARSADELRAALADLRQSEQRGDVRVLLRVEPERHAVTALVSVPNERFSSALRRRIQRFLSSQLDAEHVDIDVALGDRTWAVARFVAHLGPADVPTEPLSSLAREVRLLCRSWREEVATALAATHGEGTGTALAHTWASRFPTAYAEITSPERAAADVAELDRLAARRDPVHIVVAGDPENATAGVVKLFSRGVAIELSRFLPILESVGLWVVDEITFDLGGAGFQLHQFRVTDPTGEALDIVTDGVRVADAALALWTRRAEVDSLNRLVLRAGLGWADVAVLRALRRYRALVGTRYSSHYANDVLVEHPDVARALIALFDARFAPASEEEREEREREARAELATALDAVARLDHDRILRGLLALIDATIATDRFLDGRGDRVALQLDSSRVPDTAKPIPFREIFVYTPSMEGVHLRAGPVARGGIRWSDRLDDYRSEVHALMRAQVLKNALIVPDGAKGGFILKHLIGPPTTDTVRAAYVTFIEGLLALTHEPDGPDPYLVVAADRGTATFSDLANTLSEASGYWLGDAFASGGSSGYDHKALGITARGAWVAIQRHFRELDIDVRTEPITVVGIGDMSGDVFGNAMLQSPHLRLLAAFDHRHIFIDPNPDPAVAFAERRRLFLQGHGAWHDYDPELISDGGGVWSRLEKHIDLSASARAALGIDEEQLSPPELIRAVLSARVDLLFAGGIGTFVRSATEREADIDDRANAEVRVTADQIRARVVGEGANLAFTQRARVDYARRGGRINTDAIDNAAGVAISDREVNLKILLGQAVEAGEIDRAERDRVLQKVTDDVVAAVLDDVSRQTWAISRQVATSPARLDAVESLLQRLEQADVLERTTEDLPSTGELHARGEAGAGLTRPELAVVLAGAKRDLAHELLQSSLPDSPAVRPILDAYFPDLIVGRFGHLIGHHRLRRELVAASIANDLVNRMGTDFASATAAEAGVGLAAVARAYVAAREVVGAERWWRYLETSELSPDLAAELATAISSLLEALTRRYLRRLDKFDLAATIARHQPAFAELAPAIADLGSPARRRSHARRAEQLSDAGMDAQWAVRFAGLGELEMVPDVADVSRALPRSTTDVADAILRVSEHLGIGPMLARLASVPTRDVWSRKAADELRGDLQALCLTATHRALAAYPDLSPGLAVTQYLDARAEVLAHNRQLLRQAEASALDRLDPLTVVARALRRALDDNP